MNSQRMPASRGSNHPISSRAFLLLLILMAVASPERTAGVDASQPPNVILVLVDDQGYGDLACHGNPVLQTPNLDRLHAESIRFTDFHVNPFCAPTRAALMTGKVSDRVGVRRTLNMRNHLRAGETTLAQLFQTGGYRTALIGKWHLGHNYPYRPMDRGFEEWFGIGDCGLAATSDYWANDRFDDHYRHNGEWEAVTGFNTDVLFDRAMQFMEQRSARPFFVYLAPNVPHFPWNVHRDWLKPYRDRDLPEDLDKFYASIGRVDWNVGRLLEFLEQQQLVENTILVFSTDNGTAHFQNIYNAGMRARKGSVYDGGHRVPCFIRWPAGDLGPPRDIPGLTAHFDLFPTLAELCDLQLPTALDLDGRSLVPLLGKNGSPWTHRPWVMHSQNNDEVPVKWKDSVVLDGPWRLINGKELYNLEGDPGQKKDVAAEQPGRVSDLRAVYEAHWTRCGLGEHRDFERPLLGTTEQPVLELGPDAWVLDPPKDHLWWQGEVARGEKVNGFWPIQVRTPGRYQFEVRRWPAVLEAPSRGVPTPYEVEPHVVLEERWRMPQYQALPVEQVLLEVAGRRMTNRVSDQTTVSRFEATLGPGPADVRATLLDSQGRVISGGYFVDVFSPE